MFKHIVMAVALMFAAFTAQAADTIDINQADEQVLASELVGIGPTKAKAIVKHREEHGPFRNADELTEVSGIGEKTVEKIRDKLSFSDESK
ncbi:hypothetical protein Tel_08530 [Candidatus Tenderia electrophaga]|jgi:competence protein ComEA|uniref:Helix-hairpin-helix DNA-binding motif class 1 domain-containing protein n=1 Tax=Candidatus Tenderia electrophaga TaxID=1748243 RepID=A0A0S2TDH1_9GAMM|nr:hypothetical protein Tel_08530 [Candidatus Tenderia electrophaga]